MICRCASTIAASSAGTGPGSGGLVGWPGVSLAAGADAGAGAGAPGAETWVATGAGLADALATDEEGDRPQPLSTAATTAIENTLANRRFIRVIVSVRTVTVSILIG